MNQPLSTTLGTFEEMEEVDEKRFNRLIIKARLEICMSSWCGVEREILDVRLPKRKDLLKLRVESIFR